MRMARRSNKIHGLVNFPVHTESTNEGGMFVRLWAVASKNVGLCCGTATTELVDGLLVGTDTTRKKLATNEAFLANEWEKTLTNPKKIMRLVRMEGKLQTKLFSQFFYKNKNNERWSTALAGSMLMGSTGWSHGSFICTYENLNAKGKEFYDLFKSQYPGCKLHLLTFLDT